MNSTPYYADESVELYLGDCREVDEWLEADVLVTDPPYGIPKGRIGWHKGPPVHADAQWDSLDIRDAALALWGDRPRAVFGSPKNADRAPAHRGVPVVWDKGDSPGMGDLTWPFGASYELIWLSGEWMGPRRGSVIRCLQPSSALLQHGHPTSKPQGLMESILRHAVPGTIADPFAGSGTTLLAAKAMGRRAVGVELNEKYCEIAANRLAQDVLDFGGVA